MNTEVPSDPRGPARVSADLGWMDSDVQLPLLQELPGHVLPLPYPFPLGIPQLLHEVLQGVSHGGHVHLWAVDPRCR